MNQIPTEPPAVVLPTWPTDLADVNAHSIGLFLTVETYRRWLDVLGVASLHANPANPTPAELEEVHAVATLFGDLFMATFLLRRIPPMQQDAAARRMWQALTAVGSPSGAAQQVTSWVAEYGLDSGALALALDWRAEAEQAAGPAPDGPQ